MHAAAVTNNVVIVYAAAVPKLIVYLHVAAVANSTLTCCSCNK